jgi:hypothetical protein
LFDQLKEYEMGGWACNTHGKEGNCIQGLGKLEEKRLFVRPKHKLEDNIKMDLKEIGRKLNSSGLG